MRQEADVVFLALSARYQAELGNAIALEVELLLRGSNAIIPESGRKVIYNQQYGPFLVQVKSETRD